MAAHEVAHAITEEHFQIHQASVHARGYMTFVALFYAMSDSLREQMLKVLPGQVLIDESRLSRLVYLMDPMYFGAQSYRHFIKLSTHERQAFVQANLTGWVLAD